MSPERNTDGFLRTISKILNLPTDVMCGDTRITWIGNTKLKVENYRSILIYSECLIQIQAKHHSVKIEGEQMKIMYYDKDEMLICGLIACVRLE